MNSVVLFSKMRHLKSIIDLVTEQLGRRVCATNIGVIDGKA
jgi:hypothetical protein